MTLIADPKTSIYGQDVHRKRCYGCGPENEMGIKALYTFDEKLGEVRFGYLPHPNHEGAPGVAHGGVISALLDEAQGMLCHHLGFVVMTDNLSVHYRKMVPIDKKFYVRAALTAVRRRRLYTRAIITDGDNQLLVAASAKWYIFPEKGLSRFFKSSNDIFRPDILEVLAANKKRVRQNKQQWTELYKKDPIRYK